ncbi:MAG: hypothetical protein ABIK28_07055 [Planctomycetota bacterium]
MNNIYQGFIQFSERFGHMLSRLILMVLYFLLVTPAGLFITLFGDPLKIRRSGASNWQKVKVDTGDKKRARSQI